MDPIRKNKVQTFLDNFDLYDREIKNEINDKDIDFEDLNKNLKKHIFNSREFLIQNIDNCIKNETL